MRTATEGCQFSIFYCGCKLLKSIHFAFRLQRYNKPSGEQNKSLIFYPKAQYIFYDDVIKICVDFCDLSGNKQTRLCRGWSTLQPQE